jgi:hypothetical protein
VPRRFRSIAALLLAVFTLFGTTPAVASVTLTFWSHELGNSFPHAFLSMRGVPDWGGPAVDIKVGFTARTISPAILFGSVPGELDIPKTAYVEGSNAQMSLTLTDAQYISILAMVQDWGVTGDSHYGLEDHNCIHFVKEAARRAGLVGIDQPKLMKKPRSYLQAVAAANAGHVTVVDVKGKEYLASLPPIVLPAQPAPKVVVTTTPPPAPGIAPALATR